MTGPTRREMFLLGASAMIPTAAVAQETPRRGGF